VKNEAFDLIFGYAQLKTGKSTYAPIISVQLDAAAFGRADATLNSNAAGPFYAAAALRLLRGVRYPCDRRLNQA